MFRSWSIDNTFGWAILGFLSPVLVGKETILIELLGIDY